MSYVIEDNVPMPSKRGEKYAEMIETAKKLEVGQSFIVEYQRAGICNNLAKGTGFKFVQAVDKNDKTKLRIWRTE